MLQFMKQYFKLLFSLTLLFFYACQSMEHIAIDYMQPAEINFPDALRRVAIVNNVASQSNSRHSQSESFFQGNATIVTEALAENIAAEEYFDEVIICDSALRASDKMPKRDELTQEEVKELTEMLKADFLISVEEITISTKHQVDFQPEWGVYYGVIDATISPTVKVYLPGRQNSLVTLQCKDSIFWEVTGSSVNETIKLLTDREKIEKEGSEFAGTIPIKYLLPHWSKADRYLICGGSVNMRDAVVYVRENNWEEAISLWKQEYEKRKDGKQKMYAAYNIALGHEMLDNIPEAYEWAKQAQSMAYKIDKVSANKQQYAPNYTATTLYVNQLQIRKEGLLRLQMQLQRFKER